MKEKEKNKLDELNWLRLLVKIVGGSSVSDETSAQAKNIKVNFENCRINLPLKCVETL